MYGETESRCPEAEVKERWNRLLECIIRIRLREEEVILIGDFNKHVGCDELGISRNNEKITFGG